jgi:hypothetical protein
MSPEVVFNKYVLVVNGEALESIFSDLSLKNHFIFLAFMVKCIVGFDISPDMKKQFTINFKEAFNE